MSHTENQLTLTDLIEDYLTKNRRIRWSTRQMTERAGRYMVRAVGNIDIRELCYADAEDFQNYLISNVSRTSANSYIKTIRPIFSWAIRREKMIANPFDNLPLFKVADPEVRAFDQNEVRAILAAARKDMWRARILAAVTSGLRRGEVLNLTLNDIDFEGQTITVRPKKDTEFTWEWMPKDYEIRTVPLSPRLNNLLVSSVIPNLPAGQLYPMLTEKRYWTLRQRIGRLTERVRVCPDENFSKPFRRILNRAQIRDGCFHDLRRTAVTAWSKSLPYQEVQRLAGHSDIATTLKYYSALGADYLARARQACIA